MTRTLTSGMQTAVAAQRGTVAHFIQIESSGGTTRLSTTPVDIAWNAQTWDAIGGNLEIGSVEEAGEASAGVDLTLSGVEQSIIAILMNNQVRGREVRIWLAHIADDGKIVADPLEIFRGYQVADYTISERRPSSPGAGTVVVKTRVMSRLAPISTPMPVRLNIISHRDMLKRAALAVTDTFMQNVGGFAGREIYWGSIVPGGGGYNEPRNRDIS